MEAQRTRPSFGRWYILFLISLMYLITYLDRVNISTVAPVISKEFGFDKVTMGIIFSAFVWAYALFQVPGGWLNDRFGPRRVLAIIVAYWSVMTAATAAATGAVSFVIVRFLFGIGEGGAFPGATRAMQLWYPRHERGFCQGITHSASRLGAAITPPLVVLIMTTLGWRWVFYICAAVGIVWSALWYLAYRNLPEEHGLVNKTELEHIRGIDAAGNVNAPKIETKTSVPWATLLRSPNMWAIMCAYFTYVYCLWIFLSWLPSYLVEFRQFTLLKVGLLASLPLWAGVVGDTVGGLATDWLLKKTGNTKFARRAVAITGMLGCVVFIVPAALTADAYTAVYCLTAAMFFSRMHHRAVLGSPHGCRRQIFRDRVWDDEHGGKLRRRALPVGVRRFSPVRLVGGAVHRGSGSARRGFRGLGILAGPRRLGRRAIQTPDHSRCRRWLTRRRMSLVGPNWSSFSFVTRLAQPA